MPDGLRVSRPTLKLVPSPPAELTDWLLPDRDKIEREAEFLLSHQMRDETGQYAPGVFADAPSRVIAFTQWQEQHRRWQEAERPAYATMSLCERLYFVMASCCA